MYARAVEMNIKVGDMEVVTATLSNDFLPILKKQKGFTDLILLVGENELDHLVAVTFWRSRPEAEQFHTDCYNLIVSKLQQHMKTEPMMRMFRVDTSTVHRIAAGLAA